MILHLHNWGALPHLNLTTTATLHPVGKCGYMQGASLVAMHRALHCNAYTVQYAPVFSILSLMHLSVGLTCSKASSPDGFQISVLMCESCCADCLHHASCSLTVMTNSHCHSRFCWLLCSQSPLPSGYILN